MISLIPLIQLFSTLDHINGKKRIQKMVHLLQECEGVPFNTSFNLAHYGAFSVELAGLLDALEEQKLLLTKAQPAGQYVSVEYSATEKLLEAIGRGSNGLQEPSWAARARELNTYQVKELEAISTIVFLKKAGWTDDDVKSQFAIIKAHLVDIYDDSKEKAENLLLKSA